MHHDQKISARQSGAALLTALGLLLVFSLLGAAYLGYMTTESAGTDLVLRDVRTGEGAAGAVTAAIAEVAARLQAGQTPPNNVEITWPVYVQTPEGLVADDTRRITARVVITDESQKVNLNHATRPLLETLLGVDRGVARAITQSVPRPGVENESGGRWFVELDELVARGLMTPEQFARAPLDLLTVHTAENQDQPLAYLNINSAPVEVMAALLAMPPGQAERIVEARPFASVDDLAAGAGMDATQFALPPEALATTSRCYRFRCEAQLVEDGPADTQRSAASAAVEAVALFPDTGAPRIRYWSEENK